MVLGTAPNFSENEYWLDLHVSRYRIRCKAVFAGFGHHPICAFMIPQSSTGKTLLKGAKGRLHEA